MQKQCKVAQIDVWYFVQNREMKKLFAFFYSFNHLNSYFVTNVIKRIESYFNLLRLSETYLNSF